MTQKILRPFKTRKNLTDKQQKAPTKFKLRKNMKLNKIALPIALVLIAALATGTGCRSKTTPKVTDIKHPGPTGGPTADQGITPTPPVEPPAPPPVSTPVPLPTSTTDRLATALFDLKDYTQDPAALAADTVHFKFDSAVVEDSEQANVEKVAQALADQNLKLLIEGHCDERGTEEYNRSLGERRALALREALAKDNVDPSRVKTISYGKDRPLDPGHNEAAWAKNRRGVFILLHPKTPVP
jgi:peptidoglycan-associated lipoprotein